MSYEDREAVHEMDVNLGFDGGDFDILSASSPGEEAFDLSHFGGEHEVYEEFAQEVSRPVSFSVLSINIVLISPHHTDNMQIIKIVETGSPFTTVIGLANLMPWCKLILSTNIMRGLARSCYSLLFPMARHRSQLRSSTYFVSLMISTPAIIDILR